MNTTTCGLLLGTRTLKDTRARGGLLASLSGSVRSASGCSVALAHMINRRLETGGEHTIFGGEEDNVFTNAFMEDAAVSLGLWLTGAEGSVRDIWPMHATRRSADFPQLDGIIPQLCDAVLWVWDSEPTS